MPPQEVRRRDALQKGTQLHLDRRPTAGVERFLLHVLRVSPERGLHPCRGTDRVDRASHEGGVEIGDAPQGMGVGNLQLGVFRNLLLEQPQLLEHSLRCEEQRRVLCRRGGVGGNDIFGIHTGPPY